MAEKTKTAKVGFFKKIGKFFKDYKSEFKKLVWPTPKQLFKNTAVVLVSIVVFGAFLAAVDTGFHHLFVELANWFALL